MARLIARALPAEKKKTREAPSFLAQSQMTSGTLVTAG
jgi:hypothetical protein